MLSTALSRAVFPKMMPHIKAVRATLRNRIDFFRCFTRLNIFFSHLSDLLNPYLIPELPIVSTTFDCEMRYTVIGGTIIITVTAIALPERAIPLVAI